jgi:curved DNA-binding protein
VAALDYKDYYKILGVKQGASTDEIKKSYRKLAKEFHPDSAKGDRKKAEERFKEISEAYEVLGDAEKRKKYDEMLEQIKNGGFNPSQFSGFGGMGGDGVYTYTWSSGGDDAYGFSDFFNMFFGSMGGMDDFGGFKTRSSSARGRRAGFDGSDIEDEIKIGLVEAFRGTSRTLRIGSRTIDVKIPAGIMDGERIKVAGQGSSGFNGGKNGDLYLVIRIEPENGFTLNGLDVEKEVDLYPWEAALGGKKTVETLDVKISAQIPAGIQAGEKIRLANKGYKNVKGSRGDLFLKIRIVNPPVITAKARDLYLKLKEAYS